jgi:hypothetical protein
MDTSEPAQPAQPRPATAPSRRRRWLFRSTIAIAVLAVIAGIVFVAPDHIVRYLIRSELTRMGIVVEGIETFRIDEWRRQVWFGPVRAGAEGAQLAEVKHFGVELSLSNLLRRQALIKRIIIDGVDIYIVKEADGRLLINGIDLEPFLKPGEEPKPEKTPSPWGTGLDELELVNSRLTFVEHGRGTATLELDRLALHDYRSWTPDEPGTFEFNARLNEITVRVSGEAQPFADIIRVKARTEIEGFELPKVMQYAGPLGFERRGGSIASRLDHDMSIEREGGMTVATQGRLEASALDLFHPRIAEIVANELTVDIDTVFARNAAGTNQFTGSLGVHAEGAQKIEAAGTRLAFNSLDLGLKDIAVSIDPGGDVNAAVTPTLTIVQPQVSGPADAGADAIEIKLQPVTAATRGQEITAATAGSIDSTGLRLAAPVAATAKSVGLALKSLALASTADGKTLTAVGSTAIDSLAMSDPVRLLLASFGFEFSSLELKSGDGGVALAAAGKTALGGLAVDAPIRAEAKTIETDISQLALKAGGAGVALSLAARTQGAALALREPIEASTDTLTLDMAPLQLDTGADALTVRAGGKLGLSPVAVLLKQADGRASLSAKLAQLGLGFGDLSYRSAGGEDRVGGRIDLDLGPSTAELPQANDALRMSLDRLKVALPGVDLRLAGAAIALTTPASVDAGRIAATLPEAEGQPAIEVRLGEVRTRFDPITANIDGGQVGWSARLDASIDDLNARVADGAAARATIGRLTLSRASIDEQLHLNADELLLNKPQIAITDKLFAALAPPATTAGRRTAAAPAAAPPPRIRLGRFAVDDGGSLRFVDAVVKPPVRFKTDINVLEARDIDTGDPARRMDLRLDVTVNEFTTIQALGTAAPFGSKPEFDMTARIRGLQLPALSPYAAKAIGMNLEKGQLDLKADAVARKGVLDGKVGLDIANLGFSPLSKADAERLSASIGAPIETAVDLLRDAQGRIKLNIPVSGDLASPSFDLSRVIAKAMTGAVTAAIAAPLQLMLQPVQLVAKAVGGKITFKPVVFAPMEKTLQPDAGAFVDALATALQQQNDLIIQLCGRATAADLEAILSRPPPERRKGEPWTPESARRPLEALAAERGRAVRRALVTDKGISAGRVGECRSSFDANDREPPRVEIMM